MAYLAGNMTEEELKKQQEEGGTAPATVVGDGGLLGAQGTAPAQTESPSGTFTNLRTYIDANRPQAAGLAEKVSGVVQQKGEAAQGMIEPLKTSYQSELAKATPNVGILEQAKADPVSFASDPANVSAFGNLRQGLFQNPVNFNEFGDFAKVSNEAEKASNLEKLATGEAGKSSLIRELNPTMKQGNVDFNTVLLQGDPTAREKVVKSATPYAGLSKTLADVQSEQAQDRQKVLDQQAEANKRTQEEFVTPQMENLQNLKSSINQRVTEQSADQFNKDQAVKTLMDYIEGRSEVNLSPEQQKLFFGDSTPVAGLNKNTLARDIGQIPYAKNSEFSQDPWRIAAIMKDVLGEPLSPSDFQTPIGRANYNDYVNQLKADVGAQKYAYDMPTYLKLNPQEDWLNKYFPQTGFSQGSAGELSQVSTPEEMAKIIALQKLLDQPEFFTEDDLPMAGAYRPATIGKFTGL